MQQPAGKRPRDYRTTATSPTSAVANATEIQKHEIKLGEMISNEGNFGTVWKGVCRGSEVAIKMPRTAQGFSMSPQQLVDFRREIAMLSSIYHPNICLFLGACINNNEVLIVTELMEGNLEGVIQQQSLTMLVKLRMMQDVARGVAWLHAQHMIHRDIKPSNFLYQRSGGESWLVKVCDFGLCDLRDGEFGFLQENRPKGTPLYMAPEILRSRPYDEKSDVYSFAISMWEILTQTEPYASVTSVDELVTHVCDQQMRPPLPESWSPTLRQLMVDCWQTDARLRPSMEDILGLMKGIIVEAAVPDYAGQLFWKSLETDSVSFHRFSLSFFNQFAVLRGRLPGNSDAAPVMSGYVGEPSAGRGATESQGGFQEQRDLLLTPLCIYLLRLLKVMFASSSASDSDDVTMEHFGRVLAWLGPIESDPFLFFFRVVKLYQQAWFFGSIRTADATSLLLTQPPGTFLVRFCNRPNLMGYFVLSVVTAKDGLNVVAHIRIRHQPGGSFSLEKIPGPEHNSLISLIETCSPKLALKLACPGRKYELQVFSQLSAELQSLESHYAERINLLSDSFKNTTIK